MIHNRARRTDRVRPQSGEATGRSPGPSALSVAAGPPRKSAAGFVRARVTALGAVSQPLLSVAATAERVVIVVPLQRVLGFSPLAAGAAPLLLTIVMLLLPARAGRLG